MPSSCEIKHLITNALFKLKKESNQIISLFPATSPLCLEILVRDNECTNTLLGWIQALRLEERHSKPKVRPHSCDSRRELTVWQPQHNSSTLDSPTCTANENLKNVANVRSRVDASPDTLTVQVYAPSATCGLKWQRRLPPSGRIIKHFWMLTHKRASTTSELCLSEMSSCHLAPSDPRAEL